MLQTQNRLPGLLEEQRTLIERTNTVAEQSQGALEAVQKNLAERDQIQADLVTRLEDVAAGLRTLREHDRSQVDLLMQFQRSGRRMALAIGFMGLLVIGALMVLLLIVALRPDYLGLNRSVQTAPPPHTADPSSSMQVQRQRQRQPLANTPRPAVTERSNLAEIEDAAMTSPEVAWIGTTCQPLAEASISVLDLGFLRGLGIFETLRTYAGYPHAVDRHLARLNRSASELGIDCPLDSATLRHRISSVTAANPGIDYRVNIIVTPGSHTHGVFGAAEPTIVILLRVLEEPPRSWYRWGHGGHLPWSPFTQSRRPPPTSLAGPACRQPRRPGPTKPCISVTTTNSVKA